MSRTEYLQNLLDSVLQDDHGQWFMEYRPFNGWYACPDEPRYFGDDGVFLGGTWDRAEREIKYLFAL